MGNMINKKRKLEENLKERRKKINLFPQDFTWCF